MHFTVIMILSKMYVGSLNHDGHRKQRRGHDTVILLMVILIWAVALYTMRIIDLCYIMVIYRLGGEA